MSEDRSPGSRARRLREQRRIERGLAEMMGLVRGVIADGRVSSDEAEQLAQWTREQPDVVARWPANLLARRLEKIQRDGRLDARERAHLEAILGQLAGNSGGLGFTLATDLPVDVPAPEVVFEGRTFVFAGELAYGPARSCEREVLELGGACERTVSRRTDYVVLGSLSADDWAQDALGPVLDAVVQYRARGVPIAVIAEEHWAEALP
ncbi:MAG: BRCT domain-containing protein [Gemmatimonadetes bacterium]|nr:BRCT domain-containing protein [Gemmatimonadota bacterium]